MASSRAPSQCNRCSYPAGTGLDPEDDLGCFGGIGHGTALANIIAGNGNLGDAFRGVTDMTVDSWKVWPDCGTPGSLNLFLSAVVRAFQAAAASLDGVITTSSYQSGVSVPSTSCSGVLSCATGRGT